MNTFQAVHIEYHRPSRTIETVLVSKDRLSQVFFIYNYEGNHFIVFQNYVDLINSFQDKAECDLEFGTDEELDCFLAGLGIAE